MVVHCTVIFSFLLFEIFPYKKFFKKPYVGLIVRKQFRKRRGKVGKNLKKVKKLIFC